MDTNGIILDDIYSYSFKIAVKQAKELMCISEDPVLLECHQQNDYYVFQFGDKLVKVYDGWARRI